MGEGFEQTDVGACRVVACDIMVQGFEQTNVGACPTFSCARRGPNIGEQGLACSHLLSGGRLWTGKAPCLSIGGRLFIWMPSVICFREGAFGRVGALPVHWRKPVHMDA